MESGEIYVTQEADSPNYASHLSALIVTYHSAPCTKRTSVLQIFLHHLGYPTIFLYSHVLKMSSSQRK